MSLSRIISGGQTGVDCGALDAALECGFPCGGWCPPGRRAEDGPIDKSYPHREMQRGGYRYRTIQNIIDSDATVVIYFGQLEGGTEQTLFHCIRLHKPYQLIDAEEVCAIRAAELVAAFVAGHQVATLNIAGPRLRKAPRAHAFAQELVTQLLRNLPTNV